MAIASHQRRDRLKLRDEQRGRVQDYLDDKLQTDADLDNIDSLLRNVLEQQELLRQQV